jgi:hypothetical protein
VKSVQSTGQSYSKGLAASRTAAQSGAFLSSESVKGIPRGRPESKSKPSTQQQEVDYVEEKGQQLYGFEFKWDPKKKSKLPKTFMDKYHATGEVIPRDNFRSFVMMEE